MFSSNEKIFNIYETLRPYHILNLSEVFRDIRIDSLLLSELRKEEGLPCKQTLEDIQEIHREYCKVILEFWEQSNGS